MALKPSPGHPPSCCSRSCIRYRSSPGSAGPLAAWMSRGPGCQRRTSPSHWVGMVPWGRGGGANPPCMVTGWRPLLTEAAAQEVPPHPHPSPLRVSEYIKHFHISVLLHFRTPAESGLLSSVLHICCLITLLLSRSHRSSIPTSSRRLPNALWSALLRPVAVSPTRLLIGGWKISEGRQEGRRQSSAAP